jgi:predicted transcriptional regulator
MSLDNLALRGAEAQYAMRYLRLRAGWRLERQPSKHGRPLVGDPVRRVRIERLVDQLIEDACRCQPKGDH